MTKYNNLLKFSIVQFVLLIFLIPQTVFSQPANSPWPLDRHDAKNSGYSSYAGPSSGKLKWQYLLPSGVVNASPIIGPDGTVYISNGGYLFAINSDGSQKWQFDPKGGGMGDCSPALAADGTVYIPSASSSFYAINSDGTLKWTYHAENSFNYSSPTIGQDGTIYVGCNLDLLAISPGGSLLWKYRVGDSIMSTPAISKDGTIYVRSGTKYLCAVNSDGSLKWKLNLGSATFGGGLSPVIAADGTIYTSGIAPFTRSDDSVVDVDSLYAINPDGTTKWIFNSISPAEIGQGGFVPALDSSGNICLGGKVNDLWSTSAIFALNSSGKLLWSFQLPSDSPIGRSSPSVDANGVIYFGATNYLYALNSDGSLKWKLQADIDGSSPAIGFTGTLYYGSADGYLNAIGDGSSNNQVSIVGQSGGFNTASVPADAQVRLDINVTSNVTPNKTWLVFTLTKGGIQQPLYLLTSQGTLIQASQVTDFNAATYSFGSGPTSTIATLTMASLGLSAGDTFSYGYAVSSTDITGVQVPNIVTVNVQ